MGESCSLAVFLEVLVGSVGATKACTTVINLFGTALEHIYMKLFGQQKRKERERERLLFNVSTHIEVASMHLIKELRLACMRAK